jgi:hypothetical protein
MSSRAPALVTVALLLVGCSSGDGRAAAAAAAVGMASEPAGAAPTSGALASPSAAGLHGAAARAIPTPDHVMVVVFENKDAGTVLGASAAPYLNLLARQGAVLTDAHGVAHPSEPNYLALFSGSTHGVTDDACPLRLSGGNVATELTGAGRSFVGYSEDLPAPGWTGCDADKYARRHNPWVNFDSVSPQANQPLSAMPRNYAQLPTVSFVVPNVCDDMHDCSIATGDAWARTHLSGFLGWAHTHNSLLLVTFDEDDNGADNRIATILVGPMVRPGPDNQYVDHYGVLRTLEAMYGLPPLGNAAAAQPVTGVWR